MSGFVYAYVKKAKNSKINDEKGGDKQKKQKQDTIQFVTLWLRFWRCFINPYIFKLARNMNFHLNFCKQIWGMKRAALLWSAPGGT